MTNKIVLQLLYNSNTFFKEKTMSAKTASVIARTEPETKKAADELFEKLGLTTSSAINIFLHKAIEEKGFPFRVGEKRIPGLIYEDEITDEELLSRLDKADAEIENDGGHTLNEVVERLNKDSGLRVKIHD